MGITVNSLFWVMQDLYHQQYLQNPRKPYRTLKALSSKASTLTHEKPKASFPYRTLTESHTKTLIEPYLLKPPDPPSEVWLIL